MYDPVCPVLHISVARAILAVSNTARVSGVCIRPMTCRELICIKCADKVSRKDERGARRHVQCDAQPCHPASLESVWHHGLHRLQNGAQAIPHVQREGDFVAHPFWILGEVERPAKVKSKALQSDRRIDENTLSHANMTRSLRLPVVATEPAKGVDRVEFCFVRLGCQISARENKE